VILSHSLARLRECALTSPPTWGARLGARRRHIALPVRAGELKAATIGPVGVFTAMGIEHMKYGK
jgi:hypothetical protein